MTSELKRVDFCIIIEFEKTCQLGLKNQRITLCRIEELTRKKFRFKILWVSVTVKFTYLTGQAVDSDSEFVS